jgi:hypothetical protein
MTVQDFELSDILDQNSQKLIELSEKPLVPRKKPIPPKFEPVIKVDVKDPWFEAKKEYLSDPEAKILRIARKYGIANRELANTIKSEGWEAQRKNLYARADAKMQNLVENSLAEVKSRHALIGKMLQKVGVKTIKQFKKSLEAKEALSYLVEGVRIEREAHGIGKEQPKIVNIITQQQAIIDKYKVKDNGQPV